MGYSERDTSRGSIIRHFFKILIDCFFSCFESFQSSSPIFRYFTIACEGLLDNLFSAARAIVQGRIFIVLDLS